MCGALKVAMLLQSMYLKTLFVPPAVKGCSDFFTSLGHAVRDTSLPEAERYRLACHRAFVDEVSN